MVKTLSSMQQLGRIAPDFKLPNYQTNSSSQANNISEVALQDYAGKPVLIAFICNHCPYVVHIAKQFAEFAAEYQPKGVQVVAINANDVANYAEDSPQKMIEFAAKNSFLFPYLFDESQQVAQAYGATCTPDFFLYDEQHRLVYRGQFDASRPGNEQPVNGADMRRAVDALLSSQSISTEQIPSMGCSIKWKPNNEPDYF